MIDHLVPAAAFFARMLDTAGGGTLPTLPARAGIPPVSVLPDYPGAGMSAVFLRLLA